MRNWELDVASGDMTAFTPEGIRGRLVSPDGQWLPVNTPTGRGLWNLTTKTVTPAVKGLEAGDNAVGWSADSKTLIVGSRGRFIALNLATGARTELLTITQPQQAGFITFDSVSVALDGDHYVYSVVKQLSQLFLLKIPQ